MYAVGGCASHGDALNIDKDSIYWSKERYRLIPQRVSEFTVQYLVVDAYENEIVGTHPRMVDAMRQRDTLAC
jgi:hypothetical protein